MTLFEAALRHRPLSSAVAAHTVPVRTAAEVPPALELRAAFVLLHIDGRASVRDIAELASIPLAEVVAAITELALVGLVWPSGAEPPPHTRRLPFAFDDGVLGPDDDTLH
jgi:hypothetical protein